jgi:hypothetical protein
MWMHVTSIDHGSAPAPSQLQLALVDQLRCGSTQFARIFFGKQYVFLYYLVHRDHLFYTMQIFRTYVMCICH